MRNGDADRIASLIEPGRVHRGVYTDPDLFELEMERIFGRAWLYVGHASQVPQAGDYITTELGRQPVIMVRHRDGAVHVLLNRCTHRGAKVVNDRKGSAPRVGEYRGFVFASLAAKGPSFEDHIGPMKRNIDDLVDRAPDGELALDAGMHRYTYAGNWKLQVENVLDSYHVPFGHASTVNKQGVQFARREGDRRGAAVVETEKKETAASWKERKSYIAGNGHGWTSNTSLDEGKRSSPAYDAYRRALAEKVGAGRAREILTPRLHNSLIYPNMSIMGLNIHVRVIKPVAVDRTEVTIFPVRLVGAPAAMNAGNIRLLNVTHAAASFVQTDDLESFVRAQKGLASTLTDWVDISRGLGDEEPDRELNATRALATHEMVVRAQYKAWLGYMREAA